NKELTEDQLKEAEKETQKLTDEHSEMVEELIKHKEKEIMEV
ncbi:MAG: ribosome recycling factor, partial [Ignavibacteria bacterium]|nr:ribosome recycling factor [Ignavibacteria bacterium]